MHIKTGLGFPYMHIGKSCRRFVLPTLNSSLGTDVAALLRIGR